MIILFFLIILGFVAMTTNWKEATPLNPPAGISCKILTDGMERWKRDDAFGHMTDKEVHLYKMARRVTHKRLGYDEYAAAADKDSPSFDEKGKLVV